ncbi:MAG TPA: glycosyltransferase family 39 protein, partial [Candidatus Nitrosocosmicus sp.]|nr:glycosyltransferase family 39 protein [Candidatus Nitrosocosmicus sp.]
MSQSKRISLLFVAIPMILSVFIHLWNPVGFPAIDQDEGHYMRRAMQVIQGLGPQESTATYFYPYDHPYLGQIFLAAALSIVNYPDSLNPSVSPHSIEMLYLVPRFLMGILAVVDTFLVYKIADARYNRKVAFVSATLFAVLPSTWFLGRIFLDSIALPFLLLSILFAIYYAKSSSRIDSEHMNHDSNKLRYFLILPSGIFLGLAIFTKLPLFALIPLIIFILLNKNIINSNNNNKRTKSLDIRALGVWYLPVVLIPLIWPAYAISVGQFDSWIEGVIYQTARDSGGKDLRSSFVLVYDMDPVLLTLAAAATIYAVIRKDYFILLWSLPYLVFLYFIGWVVPIHWRILVPILCISAAMLIDNLINAVSSRKVVKFLPHVVISAFVILGFLTTSLLIEKNLNILYVQLYLYIVQELQQDNTDNTSVQKQNLDNDGGTTMIGSHRTRALVWIPLYVFKDNITFRETDIPKDNFTKPVETKRFVLVADSDLISRLTG